MTHAQDVLDKIASYQVPVIVGSIYDFPRPDERYDAVTLFLAELQNGGVKIALATAGRDMGEAQFALRSRTMRWLTGLPYDEALKAITLNPAEMFGLGDKLGSLDVGKTANVVVANGDPLDVILR